VSSQPQSFPSTNKKLRLSFTCANKLKIILSTTHQSNFLRKAVGQQVSMTRRLLLSLLFVTAAFCAAVTQPQNLHHEPRANKKEAWKPAVGAQFQMILSGTVDPAGLAALAPSTPEIWDVDLESTPKETIAAFHSMGKKVICYFSAGSSEDWRTDYSSFLPTDKGGCLGNWPGEKWLDIRSENVFQVMKKRIASAAEKGCDGVDPDNMGKNFTGYDVPRS
jgi:hypothetical protein